MCGSSWGGVCATILLEDEGGVMQKEVSRFKQSHNKNMVLL